MEVVWGTVEATEPLYAPLGPLWDTVGVVPRKVDRHVLPKMDFWILLFYSTSSSYKALSFAGVFASYLKNWSKCACEKVPASASPTALSGRGGGRGVL